MALSNSLINLLVLNIFKAHFVGKMLIRSRLLGLY